MSNDYVIELGASPLDVPAHEWNSLLAQHRDANPFMRHEYLAALHHSLSAHPDTGWTPRWIMLRRDGILHAACALYLKSHSMGEYVFDWTWARAYAQHGLDYYPKALVAVPFTPVPGVRLLAQDVQARQALVQAVLRYCRSLGLSSLHLLFLSDDDATACEAAGLMLRRGVQFHWRNATASAYASFDAFLAELSQDKRKKIRQERRKVAEAGVTFRWVHGQGIRNADWDFFYSCYERTYLEHGNPPYLSRAFFSAMAQVMPQHWLMFIAQREGRDIAVSLIALSHPPDEDAPSDAVKIAYGRYWGALERVDSLHFETCYYQPLQWCIAHGYSRFEGGAQGEHKMARALMPVQTYSAHWLAHPSFSRAVTQFLQREHAGLQTYMEQLNARTPFRQSHPAPHAKPEAGSS